MTMTTRTSLGAALALSAAAAVFVSAAPQQTPAQTQTRPAQTFQARTLVIEVDAIVTDSKGRFVEDLTPGDFEVLDGGEPQTVQTLYRVEGTSVTPIAPMAAPAARASAAAPAAAPPRADRRVYVLFFDEPHLTQGAFHRLQQAAADYLQRAFAPGDIGGVLIGDKMAGSRLTSNRDQLVEALKSSKLSPEATSRARDLQDWPRMSAVEAIRIAVNYDNDVLSQVADRAAREGGGGPDLRPTIMDKARTIVRELDRSTQQTLTTLASLAHGLDRVPGRKTIVFMSEGFYTQNAESALRQIVGIAARSNVRIYAIDARGLNRMSDGGDPSVMSPMETGAAIPTNLYDTIEDAPNTLAVDTGGYVVRNTNAFEDALAGIETDTSHYYVLGYSPTNTKMDGRFRQITVKVGRPGLTVRARKGYLALPPGEAAPPLELRANEASEPANGTAAGSSPTAAVALSPQTQAHIRAFAASQPKGGAAQTLADDGWNRYTKGDLAGAAAKLEEAAAAPAAASWITYALGYAQFGQGRTKEAVASWEKVRAAAPDFEGVYLDLANGYLTLSDPVHAVSVLRVAEQRWPNDLKVLNAIGTLQVRQQVLDDAIHTFQKAIDANTKDPTAYLNIARTYELRYYKMRRYSRPGGAQAANPEDAKRAIENYEAYLKHGGPDKASARAAIERLKQATRK